MSPAKPRGRIYRCPVCGAEVLILALHMGQFSSRCCNVEMVQARRRVVFYLCPVCGAEVAILTKAPDDFRPHCCSVEMKNVA